MELSNQTLLKNLCNIPGVSGYEENIQKFIKIKIKKLKMR